MLKFYLQNLVILTAVSKKVDDKMEQNWNNLPKYVVVGSDKSIAMSETTIKQIAIDHAEAMNRSNAEGDNRHWRVIEKKDFQS